MSDKTDYWCVLMWLPTVIGKQAATHPPRVMIIVKRQLQKIMEYITATVNVLFLFEIFAAFVDGSSA